MDVSVIGKHVDVGQALRSHVEENLTTSVTKYFDKAIEASLTLSRESHTFRADISVHAAKGIMMQGHALAEEPYAACDAAIEKVAKQLRRQKRKMRDHHKDDRSGEDVLPAEQVSGPASGDDAG